MAGGIDGIAYNERQVQIIVVTTILVLLSTSAVVLRCCARRLSGTGLFKDDWVIIVALLLSYGNCVCEYVGLQYGLGRHEEEVGKGKAHRYMLVLFVLQMFWNTTLPTIKLSILLFYKRLFPTQRMKRACNCLGAMLLLWYIAFQTTAIAQCAPISFYWNKKIEHGQCIKFVPFYIALAATNVFTDVVILALPMPLVWKLQVKTPRKIGLTITFLLGTLVCVVAIVRITTLNAIDPEDITWSNTYAGIWTAIEGSVGTAVACLPSLMPIYFKLRGKTDRSFPTPHQTDENHTRPYWSKKDPDGFERILNSQLSTDPTFLAEIRSSGRPDDESLELADRLPRDAIKVSTKMEQSVTQEVEGVAPQSHEILVGV